MKSKNILKVLFAGLATLFLLITNPVRGADAAEDANLRNALRNGLWQQLNTGPDGNLLGNESAIAFQIYDKNDKINLNYALPTSVRPATDGDKFHTVWSAKLNASTPVNPDDKENPMPTLDALVDAYTVGVSVNFSTVPSSLTRFADFAGTRATEWSAALRAVGPLRGADANLSASCNAELTAVFMGNGVVSGVFTSELRGTVKDLGSFFEAVDARTAALETVANRSAAENQTLLVLQALQMDPYPYISVSTAVAEHCMPAFYNEHIRSLWFTDEWTTTYAFEATTGTEEFDFLNPTSFESMSETKQVHAATLSFTRHKISRQGSLYWSAGYTYQRAYALAKESEVCKPDSADPNKTTCKSGIFGAPDKNTTSILSIEINNKFNNVIADQPIAIRVKFSRDLKQDTSGLDIPLYLFSLGGDELNAGLRVGWQSKTDETNVGFFYGQKF